MATKAVGLLLRATPRGSRTSGSPSRAWRPCARPSPEFPEWTKASRPIAIPTAPSARARRRPRPPASGVAALLRMGVGHRARDAVVAAMKEGQRPDGGWSKDDGPSDLGTSYRVMRAFFMLKEAPDLAAIRKFIAGCRKPDGGYSATPDGAADPSGTYYATIILGWARAARAASRPSSRRPGSSPSSTARTWTAGRGTRRSGRPATGCSWGPRPA